VVVRPVALLTKPAAKKKAKKKATRVSEPGTVALLGAGLAVFVRKR